MAGFQLSECSGLSIDVLLDTGEVVVLRSFQRTNNPVIRKTQLSLCMTNLAYAVSQIVDGSQVLKNTKTDYLVTDDYHFSLSSTAKKPAEKSDRSQENKKGSQEARPSNEEKRESLCPRP